MSRNRVAILADIEQFNLDPNKAHRGTHANGRLAKATGGTVEVQVDEKQHEVIVAPVTLVEKPETVEVVEEPKVVIEGEKSHDVDEPKVTTDPAIKKKGKKQATE